MNAATLGRRLLGAALLWIVLAGFEIGLVGKLDPQETPVGIAVALLAAVAAFAAAALADTRYALRAAWLWLPLLVARNIVRDTFIVFGVLLRRLGGAQVRDAFIDVPFDPGGDDDPAGAGRRALATAGVSTSPNEIVLAIDREKKAMRVHVLVDTKAGRHSAEWPL